MEKVKTGPISLTGFNNLTKCLSFNLYDFCIARNQEERDAYQKYIAERFSAKKVTKLLTGICDIIEANVLAVSDQDYEPWGASSMVLMSELKGDAIPPPHKATHMHLDKSHICAHTYPDFTQSGEICSFRIDIDISTCGDISPLNALNFMFEQMDSDVVVVDYVVRGFTRDENGKHVYMDHKVNTIQDYVGEKILRQYSCWDLVLQAQNIWQTKMLRTEHALDTYFLDPQDMSDQEKSQFLSLVKNEMEAVIHMPPTNY